MLAYHNTCGLLGMHHGIDPDIPPSFSMAPVILEEDAFISTGTL